MRECLGPSDYAGVVITEYLVLPSNKGGAISYDLVRKNWDEWPFSSM